MNTDGRSLRALVLGLVTLGVIAPILLGLWQTARAAFGILPAIGATKASLTPFYMLYNFPGFTSSLRLTLGTGIAATVISLILSMGLCATLHGHMQPKSRWLTPILATPHAALAIGLAFLIAPSGWIARALAPLLSWQNPPDIASLHDPYGLALILGLVIKELPFLLLVTLAALAQLPVNQTQRMARALGYPTSTLWLKLIAPQVYPLIRLPIFVVLAFSLSTVDMAIILGPGNPAPLAVATMRWFSNPDAALLPAAFAAALLQGAVVLAAILLWISAEKAFAFIGRNWIHRGSRQPLPGLKFITAIVALLGILTALSLLNLGLWSITWRWSWPDLLPSGFALQNWINPQSGWANALFLTLKIGAISTAFSLALAILWLESEAMGQHKRAKWAEALIYFPLLLPQIGFLYGLNVTFLYAGLNASLTAVIWAHLLFTFPYVMITLSDSWRAVDPRLIRTAAALGAGPWRRFHIVKLPLLLRPILTAAAVGFAVSVAQYLPTLFMGAGRIATLTTEAVTLSSGSDRRIVGVYAVLQALLPLAAYVLAVLAPNWQTSRQEPT
jgi:putative thiamine transport system permease protein